MYLYLFFMSPTFEHMTLKTIFATKLGSKGWDGGIILKNKGSCHLKSPQAFFHYQKETGVVKHTVIPFFKKNDEKGIPLFGDVFYLIGNNS